MRFKDTVRNADELANDKMLKHLRFRTGAS
jgi:hypothetical protein